MPRPERELDPAAGPAAAFAHLLRELRRASGLSLSQVAEKTFYARSTLSVAFGGVKVPTWDLVHKVVTACGASEPDLPLWRARWEAAQNGQFPHAVRAVSAQDPDEIADTGQHLALAGNRRNGNPRQATSMAELAEQLDQLRQRRRLTWRALARQSEKDGTAYASSTLHEAIVVRACPPLAMTLRVVQICGGSAADLVEWGEQWARLDQADSREVDGTARTRPRVRAPGRDSDVVWNYFYRILERAMETSMGTRRLVLLVTVPLLAALVTLTGVVVLLSLVFKFSPSQWGGVGVAAFGLVGTALAARGLRRRSYQRRE